MVSCSDDVIWQVINNQFCAFKITTPQEESFCRNEYNVTGVCSRITCPLANAQYATVRSVDGANYLYIKTPERQHMPSKWWMRVRLSKDYDEAQKELGENLAYWPERLVDRCRQRLTRLYQVQLAERRLAMQQDERQYTTKSSKVKRREASRERKALVAAKLERAIERELLDRLKSGAYGDQPLNVDEAVWKRVMAGMNSDATEETEALKETEEETEPTGEVEFVEDEDDDEELVDVEDIEQWLDQSGDSDDSENSDGASNTSDGNDSSDNESKPKPRKRVSKPNASVSKRRNIEYEFEDERQVVRA